jgi:hypothetical protein
MRDKDGSVQARQREAAKTLKTNLVTYSPSTIREVFDNLAGAMTKHTALVSQNIPLGVPKIIYRGDVSRKQMPVRGRIRRLTGSEKLKFRDDRHYDIRYCRIRLLRGYMLYFRVSDS